MGIHYARAELHHFADMPVNEDIRESERDTDVYGVADEIAAHHALPAELREILRDESLAVVADSENKDFPPFRTTYIRLCADSLYQRGAAHRLDYTGRGMLDPAFANVAFGLTDPKKVSKIVESEFGFHIIQLIDKRGDKIKVRHILRKPVVSDDAVQKALLRLDTVATSIRQGEVPEMLKVFINPEKPIEKFTFEDAVIIEPKAIAIVEGSYACHPLLRDLYDMRIFLDIDPEVQLERIQKRNGTAALERFKSSWIPLEETYFRECKVPECCDYRINLLTAQDCRCVENQ